MKIITYFNSIFSFETDRLKARKIEASDLNNLMRMHEDPIVMETLGGVRSKEKTQENLDFNLR